MDAQKKHIHLIGNAHIDILWLWDWNEGIQEIRSTFASALDRIDENKEFIFTSACAYYYEIVERIDPSLFKRIQKAVSDGRWHITGGWWLQPDCNAPNGESFVRQGLYGQHYFLEKFGAIATSGYNVDSFGHNGNLPQILKKMGITSYVFMRPGKSEKSLPASAFAWVGIDGTSVVTFRIPPNYNNSSDWGEGLEPKMAMLREYVADEDLPMMAFYGVGNHGGGPTKENLRILDAYCAEDPSIIYSDVGKYFEELSQYTPLEKVKDDLQFHAIGCYSAHSQVKMLNNQSEHALVLTEKILSTLSPIIGSDKQEHEMLTKAWKHLLVNHFHDALGGCSIPQAYPKVINAYGYVLETACDLTTFALQKLVSRIKTYDVGSALVVFNPHPWSITQPIELNLIAEDIIDIEGNRVDFEIVPSDSIGNSFTHHSRLVVTLPPLGYTTYHIASSTTKLDGSTLREIHYIRTLENTLRTDNLVVTIDPELGVISSIKNCKTDKEYLGKGGIAPVMISDNSDTWSHALHSYNGLVTPMTLTSFTMVSDGKISTEYELVYHYNQSTVVLRLILHKKLDIIDIRLKAEFNEHQKILALRYAGVECDEPQFRTEIPNGAIKRTTDGYEYPIHRWAHIGDKGGSGLCVLNNGVYSASARDSVMQFTLLRSPIFAHHQPAHPRPDINHNYMEFGEHRFSFRVLISDSMVEQEVYGREALAFNQQPIVQVESIHDGDQPLEQSFCALNGDPSIVLSTIKRAEKEDGWIIRLYESHGKSAKGSLNLNYLGVTTEVTFEPFELKSLLIDSNKVVSETDLLERHI